MRKYFLILTICFFCCRVAAQQYYNEWIDYSKTYYKFKVGSTGLYRINQPNLPTALQSIPAEQFQLWRNGKEVAIYTSVSSGPLPSHQPFHAHFPLTWIRPPSGVAPHGPYQASAACVNVSSPPLTPRTIAMSKVGSLRRMNPSVNAAYCSCSIL